MGRRVCRNPFCIATGERVDNTGYCSDSCQTEEELRGREQAAADEYYAITEETVLVPVKVKYHDATGIVYSFVPPTREDVEKALKGE